MKKAILPILNFLLIPAGIVLCTVFFPNRFYLLISFVILAVSIVPVLIRFQKREIKTATLVLIAALTALSIAGRILFAPFPGFKPVSAFVILTAFYFGADAGYVSGALTALVSNVYFGQGPWTPYQMAIWGSIGFLAGVLSQKLKKNRVLLCIYGAASGILFSALMDVWTAIYADGVFRWNRYLALLCTGLPFTALYAVSNVVFLLLLLRPVGGAIDRLKTKYDI